MKKWIFTLTLALCATCVLAAHSSSSSAPADWVVLDENQQIAGVVEAIFPTALGDFLRAEGAACNSTQALPRFDIPSTGVVICNLATCECYDCQIGGGCVPVPPPAWCP